MIKIKEFGRVIAVVLLQDMRTRFGSSYLSYLVAIGWPLAHITLLMGIFIFRTAVAPIGDSPSIFILTGLAPFICILYPTRFIGMAFIQNRQLLNIPAIRPMHLVISRCVLESMNSLIVLAIVFFGMTVVDIDVIPADTIEVAAAIGAAMFLGVGFGCFNIILNAIVGPFVAVGFILFVTFLYIFSGVYIPASTLPENYREYMAYNPLFHLVEWLRSAYFLSYDSDGVNKPLIFMVAGVLTLIGLAGERFIRGKI